MTLDTRARRAAQGIRRAVEVMEMSMQTKEPRTVERFDRFRDRKQRNRRIGALVVTATLTIVAIVLVSTNVWDRGQGLVPAREPDASTSVERPKLMTLTKSEDTCILDLAAALPAGVGSVTAANESDSRVSFVLFVLPPRLTFEEFEVAVRREERRAERGQLFMGAPAGADRVTSFEVRPGKAVTLAVALSPGTYAVACLQFGGPPTVRGPVDLVGPIEVS